jgi:hypothetical protein
MLLPSCGRYEATFPASARIDDFWQSADEGPRMLPSM